MEIKTEKPNDETQVRIDGNYIGDIIEKIYMIHIHQVETIQYGHLKK